MKYEFTPDLATNNEIIDYEHKCLLNAANDLVEKIAAGEGKESIDAAIIFLLKYVSSHFQHEEELQVNFDYPGYHSHKASHEKFESSLNELFKKTLENESASIVVVEITVLLANLVNHIKTEDKELAEYIQSMQI